MSDSIGSQLAMLKELLKITSEHHSKQIDELNKFEPLNEKVSFNYWKIFLIIIFRIKNLLQVH